LSSFPREEFDIMDRKANGNAFEGEAVARTKRSRRISENSIANGEMLRSEDIAAIAVAIADEREERRSVRIVFDCFDNTRNPELSLSKLNVTKESPMTTAARSNGNSSGTTSSSARTVSPHEAFLRPLFRERRVIN
jgi:hypothetical protein